MDRFGQDWTQPRAVRIEPPAEVRYYRSMGGRDLTEVRAVYRRLPGLVERWEGVDWVEVDWYWFIHRSEYGDPTLDELTPDEAQRLTEGG